MFKATIQKIKSETGASLSMALMLFLVCSVVGAAVLTAASTAAGRISQIRETDQRYYSVASAVQLLIDEIDGESITVERRKIVNEFYDIDYTSSGAIDLTFKHSDPPVYECGFTDNEAVGKSLLHDAAYSIVWGDKTLSDNTKWENNINPTVTSVAITAKTAFPGVTTTGALDVNITATIQTNGNIEFKIDSNGYIGTAVFKASIPAAPSIYEHYSEEYRGGQLVSTTTTTKTSNIRWTLFSVHI